ncbi:hypothetical protein MTE01_28380 [Microbacterium testaceum]|uniref:Uncharacterized protein n=1 Tax=Microbacterium testaceum TaxID=2033 RepID=A0A4Y3QQE4_MICTE|nr:hypothetical protein MTE01_28380 [Microbacterium testaceum]
MKPAGTVGWSGNDQVPRISADDPDATVSLVKSRESIDAVVARSTAAPDAGAGKVNEAPTMPRAANAANDTRAQVRGLTGKGNEVTMTPMQDWSQLPHRLERYGFP